MKTILTWVLLLFSAVLLNAKTPIPGVRLIEGYQHKAEGAEDSAAGKIWKEGGLTITYDIGRLAGLYADPKKRADYAWFRQQQIGERIVYLAREKDNRFIVTFAGEEPANFHAKVSSAEEMAEMLLIVLSYE